MKLASFEAIIRVLNSTNVRYLVVGGTAVNAHGYIEHLQWILEDIKNDSNKE